MADTSLWPVVVGGLLTGLFALGGIGVGAVVAARRDVAQQRHEKAKRRADKFEELVAAVYEFDHWLTLTRQRELEKKEGIPETVSPFAKVQAISSVYFPQFSKLVGELDIVSSQYVAWIYNPQETTLSGTGKARPFHAAYKPYVNNHRALLRRTHEVRSRGVSIKGDFHVEPRVGVQIPKASVRRETRLGHSAPNDRDE